MLVDCCTAPLKTPNIRICNTQCIRLTTLYCVLIAKTAGGKCTHCRHDMPISTGRHLLRILFITNRTSAATVEKLITSPCINYLLLNFGTTTMKAVLSHCWYLTNVTCHTRQGNKIITCRNKLREQSSFFCHNTSLKGYFIVRIGKPLVCSSLI